MPAISCIICTPRHKKLPHFEAYPKCGDCWIYITKLLEHCSVAECLAYLFTQSNIVIVCRVKGNGSELGKVDVGGGGTIAYILANKGVDVIDCGVGVLSMHAPYEVTSKYDIYTAYRAYKAFWYKD